jgi:hypothetical protein
MTKGILVGLFAIAIGIAMPGMATSSDCCAPGAACCQSGCCK